MFETKAWTLGEWQAAYREGGLRPQQLLPALLASLSLEDPAWISLISESFLRARILELEAALSNGTELGSLPLYGVPFAVKDNIDVAGLPTTCACPAFSYTAGEHAVVVQKLLDAGAVVIGKTNLDQFATGLVGTRSPYGSVPNSFDPEYIGGGSSSGSASVVARGLLPFALGTDTAGSGRVPAGFNNIVGLKPTRGLISTRGLVPACRTLDCISILALTVEDADYLLALCSGFDAGDPYSRRPSLSLETLPKSLTLGVPDHPQWFGDARSQAAFTAALGKIETLGVSLKPIDFGPLHEVAILLYEGAWLAERYAAVQELLETNPDAIHPVVRGIIDRARDLSAVDVFNSEYRRAELARVAEQIMQGVDALLVPTTPSIYTQSEIAADPIGLNARLGTYTNFVNLLDMCALALPAGSRSDKLPFGITLIGRGWKDGLLADFGRRWQAAEPWNLGNSERADAGSPLLPLPLDMKDRVTVAVVGAHLSGMPLNYQLTERHAVLLESTYTARSYRLYALPGTVPPKPGLMRSREGATIAVELWAMPLEHFGSFVALVPPPLGIGNLELIDGRVVKGFICEAIATEGAEDITALGGWRAYMAERAKH